jgi:hypothetical protein
MLASLSVLCGGASAQVVTEFSAGIMAGGGPFGIMAGPEVDTAVENVVELDC